MSDAWSTMSGEWYTTAVPRTELKKLMKRDNWHGLVNVGLFAALLVASGWVAVRLMGTAWAIPAFFVYGTLFANVNPRWHETSHATTFRTPWLNEVVYHVATLLDWHDAVFTRWSHFKHHSFTSIRKDDPEFLFPKPVKFAWDVLSNFFFLKFTAGGAWLLLRHALGIRTPEAKSVVPPEEHGRMFWSARVVLLVHAAVIAASICFGTWVPVLLITLPRFYGGWLFWLYALTQHAGLAQDVWDHRMVCRSVKLNPVNSFLFMRMEYHTEHHMFPNVPFHALPKLNRLVAEDWPKTYHGLWDVLTELFPVLWRQRKDVAVEIRHVLPRKRPAP
jgi:fatty acid desaturase